MDRRRDGFVDNFIVDTTFETHSKSCYIVAAFTMRGKRAWLQIGYGCCRQNMKCRKINGYNL